MKRLMEKPIFFLPIILLFSCIAVDKGVRKTSFSTPQKSLMGRIKNEIKCTIGERLEKEVVFSSTNHNNNPLAISKIDSSLLGDFNKDILSGSVVKVYVGISYQGDLLFAERIENKGAVEGYNLSLSLCSRSGDDGYDRITEKYPPLAERISFNNLVVGQEEIITLVDEDTCSPFAKILDAKLIVPPHPDLGVTLFSIALVFYPLICPF